MSNTKPSSLTGGRGNEYESRVGAYFLAHLLIKFPIPGMDEEIKKIIFQNKKSPIKLDDKVVLTKSKRIFIQIKFDLSIGNNEDFKDILSSCISFLDKGDFNPNSDEFLIVIGTYNKI